MTALDRSWWRRLGRDHTLDLGALGEISDTALTRESEIALSGTGCPIPSCRGATSPS